MLHSILFTILQVMNKQRHQYYTILLTIIANILLCSNIFCFAQQTSCTSSDAFECTLSWSINSLIHPTNTSIKNINSFETRDIIAQYCHSLLWSTNDWRIYFYYSRPNSTDNNWIWEETFDSHQSLFVYALCSSFKDNNNNFVFIQEDSLDDAFKNDIAKTLKLRQISWWKNKCSPDDSYSLNECDMSTYATEIFSAIMSDLFKIKYSQVLHIDTSENFSKERTISNFMNGYFTIKTPYSELKKSYPQTIGTLESNQKQYKNILDNLKILNNSNLNSLAEESGCKNWKSITWTNFIACALHSSQWKWWPLTPSFLTLFYNEILHYNIFKIYIQYWIDQKITNMTNSDQILEFQAKSLDFQWYTNMQIEASMQALHSFEEFAPTYPLHIWLLMYQEKIETFRNKHLSPIITSFYSLSEKLQNVQLPQ